MNKLINRYTKWILLACILLAAALRLYKLGDVPISPNWDEVSYAYNAFSILETGKDEYGKFLPIVLESYNDYKPALFVYLTLPTVAIFGLTSLAVRLPAALFGILAIPVAYYFTYLLFKRKKIALLASFFLALSPMHIQFSRTAFESNIGALLNVLIAILFIKGLKRNIYLPFAAVLAGLNIYLYQAEKIFTPLLVLLLIAVYWKDFKKVSKGYIGVSVALGILVVTPMLSFMFTNPESLIRAQGTSIFSKEAEILDTSTQRLVHDRQNNNFQGFLFNNRRVEFAKEITSGYLSSFDPKWMFITGDVSEQRHPPFMGNMYIWSLPFLLLGIYSLVWGKYERRVKILLFGWIIITPIPSAFTYDVPNTIRLLNFLPVLQILLSLGILQFIMLTREFLKRRWLKTALCFIVIFSFCFNVVYYLNQYFVQYNKFSAEDWQYGYKESVEFTQTQGNDYDKIVVYNKEPLEQSYMFFLFYLKYPPQNYHEYLDSNTSGQFDATHAFGRYEFRPIHPGDAARNPNNLYIGVGENFSEEDNVLQTITTPSGEEVMYIVSGSNEKN